jgi:hypothetical protein
MSKIDLDDLTEDEILSYADLRESVEVDRQVQDG